LKISELNIRQVAEDKEAGLSPHAARSGASRGRLRHEEPCPIRTNFQRDRDRIIHSKAFRRLKHKTQVFIIPLGDHYVTRLTHTLEVSQLARTIARALNLNEDLTEAISLGHDLGHTPFGHIGEEVLNELYSQGFKHNEQSLRVVDLLEKDGRGLNLTWEVRDGILNHSKSAESILGRNWGKVNSYEGEVCKIADAIAYINHDIGDAIRAGIIAEAHLPRAAVRVLGQSHRERINTMVGDNVATPTLRMSRRVTEATNSLRQFLFKKVYHVISAKADAEKAREVVQKLYEYFTGHEDKLPPEYRSYSDELARRVVDYIAGMTDRYALNLAEKLSLIPLGTTGRPLPIG
jgi:dGTPase